MNTITKAITLLEQRFGYSATVLAVRPWSPSTLVEIDLHLPECRMDNWKRVQYMKCKVASFTYRDYSISGWDADTQTCTLFVDTGHEGPGSRWAAGLQAGDLIHYMSIDSSHHEPVRDRRMVVLGDETSLGHFLALRQMAVGGRAIEGVIAMGEEAHRTVFPAYFPQSGLDVVSHYTGGGHRGLEDWVDNFRDPAPSDTVFYLAGHIPTVVGLRKTLKRKGYEGSQIRAQGFWD